MATPDQRLTWQANALPPDDLCVENAIMLTRFNRYPLVIDPSGQAAEFLMNQYAEKRITKTSFLDTAFMKNLESSLRFGTPLLVNFSSACFLFSFFFDFFALQKNQKRMKKKNTQKIIFSVILGKNLIMIYFQSLPSLNNRENGKNWDQKTLLSLLVFISFLKRNNRENG